MPQCKDAHKEKVLSASLFNVRTLVYILSTTRRLKPRISGRQFVGCFRG